MLHNKYFALLEQFLGDYHRDIYGRGLVKKVTLSQKAISLTLDELEQEGILRSRKEGTLKHFHLNLENTALRDVLLLTETVRKITFLQKHRTLAHLFKDDTRIVGIFGSYARGEQRKESDIDVFVIGTRLPEDYDKKGEPFDVDISIKYFSRLAFQKLLREKHPLIKEIIATHIMLFGTEAFIRLLWRDYYGFS